MVIVKESKGQPLKEDKMTQTGIGLLLELLIKMRRGLVKATARNKYFSGGGNAVLTGTQNATKITPVKGSNLMDYEFIISGQYLAIYNDGKPSGSMIIDNVNWGINHLIFDCGSDGNFTLTF